MANFLQEHYNQARLAGCSHAIYVVENDLSDRLAEELKANFEREHPEGVPEEKIREFSKRLEREAESARLKDDIEWHLGIGRYGQ